MPLLAGHRLLVAGNGGQGAAEAQHLTAELVGRYVARPAAGLSAHRAARGDLGA